MKYKSEIVSIAKVAIHNSFQLLAQPLFLVIDSAVIGNFLGSVPLAGMSLAFALIEMFFGIFIFSSIITNTSVSRALGQNKIKDAVSQGINGIVLCLAIGILFCIVFYFGSDFIIANMFHPEADVEQQAVIFLRIMAFGLPGGIVISTINGIMRAFGKVKMLSLYSALSCSVNALLNIYLICFLHLGIAGSALGSTIVWTVQFLLMLIPVYNLIKTHQVRAKSSISGLFESLMLAIPITIRSSALWVALTIQMIFITKLGTTALAASQISESVLGLCFIGIDGVEITIQSLIGKKLGARDYVAAKKTLSAALRLGFIISVIICLIMLIFSFIIPHFYTQDEVVIEYAGFLLIETAIILLYATSAFIMDGAYVAANDTSFQAISVLIAVVIFIPVGYCLSLICPHNPLGLMIAWIGYDGVVLGLRTVFGVWRKNNDRWLNKFIMLQKGDV